MKNFHVNFTTISKQKNGFMADVKIAYWLELNIIKPQTKFSSFPSLGAKIAKIKNGISFFFEVTVHRVTRPVSAFSAMLVKISCT